MDNTTQTTPNQAAVEQVVPQTTPVQNDPTPVADSAADAVVSAPAADTTGAVVTTESGAVAAADVAAAVPNTDSNTDPATPAATVDANSTVAPQPPIDAVAPQPTPVVETPTPEPTPVSQPSVEIVATPVVVTATIDADAGKVLQQEATPEVTPTAVVNVVNEVMAAKPSLIQNPVNHPKSISGVAEVDEIIKDVPAANQAIFGILANYAYEMQPNRPVSTERGSKLQVALYKTVVNLINREETGFDSLFRGLLKFIQVHREGIFHELHLFRFMESVALTSDERRAFQNLMHLLREIANPVSRKQMLKQIDIERALRYGLVERGRQKVINFLTPWQ